MKDNALVPADQAMDRVARACQEKLDGAAQLLQLDLDPGMLFPEAPGFREAMCDLLLFASASAPTGCTLTLSAARPATRLTVVGASSLALRWQVDGLDDEALSRVAEDESDATVVPIRPGIRSAATLTQSVEANRLRQAFAELGTELRFDVQGRGEEIIARVENEG